MTSPKYSSNVRKREGANDLFLPLFREKPSSYSVSAPLVAFVPGDWSQRESAYEPGESLLGVGSVSLPLAGWSRLPVSPFQDAGHCRTPTQVSRQAKRAVLDSSECGMTLHYQSAWLADQEHSSPTCVQLLGIRRRVCFSEVSAKPSRVGLLRPLIVLVHRLP